MTGSKSIPHTLHKDYLALTKTEQFLWNSLRFIKLSLHLWRYKIEHFQSIWQYKHHLKIHSTELLYTDYTVYRFWKHKKVVNFKQCFLNTGFSCGLTVLLETWTKQRNLWHRSCPSELKTPQDVKKIDFSAYIKIFLKCRRSTEKKKLKYNWSINCLT